MSDAMRDVVQQLLTIIDSSKRRILLESAARAVLAKIQSRTNVGKTGRLKAATRIVSVTDEEAWIVNDNPVANFVHEGTRSHYILPKYISGSLAKSEGNGSNVLVFELGGQRVFARKVKHPGYKGNPFFDLGLADAQGDLDRVMERFGDEILAEVVR